MTGVSPVKKKKKKITLDVQIFREDLIEVLHGNTRKLRVLR